MHYFPVDNNVIEDWKFFDNIDYYEYTKAVFYKWDVLKVIWQQEADESPTMYKWLKDNIYND